jgi:hypothetical protein
MLAVETVDVEGFDTRGCSALSCFFDAPRFLRASRRWSIEKFCLLLERMVKRWRCDRQGRDSESTQRQMDRPISFSNWTDPNATDSFSGLYRAFRVGTVSGVRVGLSLRYDGLRTVQPLRTITRTIHARIVAGLFQLYELCANLRPRKRPVRFGERECRNQDGGGDDNGFDRQFHIPTLVALNKSCEFPAAATLVFHLRGKYLDY